MTAAFWLLLVSAVLALAGGAASVVDIYTVEGAAAIAANLKSTPGALDGELDIDSLIRISQVTAVAIQVLFIAVSVSVVLWIALALRGGHRYIRVVASVLVVFQLLVTAASPSPLSLVSLGVVSGAVILSWLPSSSSYLAHRTALRRRTSETISV